MAKSLPLIKINGRPFYLDDQLAEARSVDCPHERIDFANLREYRYWHNELQHLIGQSIVHADLEYDDGIDGWFPYLQLGDGSVVYLLSDEEGNAGGRIQIQDA